MVILFNTFFYSWNWDYLGMPRKVQLLSFTVEGGGFRIFLATDFRPRNKRPQYFWIAGGVFAHMVPF